MRDGTISTGFLFLTAALLLGASACVTRATAERGPGGPPEILELIPASGPAGPAYPIDVVIRGRNFMATGNVVMFGPVELTGLPSSDDGTRIRLSVPKEIPSRGEVPPLVLPPGDYPVTVTTPAGTSRPVLFTLTPGGQ